MRNLLNLFVLAIIFQSCASQRWCEKHYPEQPSVVIKDTVIYREKLVYRDTTIRIEIPGKVVHDSIIIEVPQPSKPVQQISSKKLTRETDFAAASAWVKGGILYLDLVQKDTVIQRVIKEALKESTYWKDKYHSETTKLAGEKKYQWGTLLTGVFAGMFVMIVLLIALAYIRKYI
jgi:hypothetical protein